MNTSHCVIRATVFGLCFLVPCTAYSQADVAPAGGNLTITGTVVMQDGAPAVDAYVDSPGAGGRDTIHARADGQGRFRLSGHFGYGCRLHVRSADEVQHATLLVSAGEARTRFAKPVDFKLTPATEQVVTVLSPSGQPVAAVHVLAEGRAYRTGGVTGADGTVKLKLPTGGELQVLVAWHPTLGAAGRLDYQKGLEGDSFQLELLPSAPHTIRVLDVDGRPVPDLSFGVSLRTMAKNWIATDDLEAARLQTNARGEVTVPWFPQDLLYVNARISGDDWKIDDIERDTIAEGLTTVHVRHKIAVSGHLRMPAGASAEGIVVSGFGFGPKNNGDVPAARAAADGSFTLSVAPDHGYALYIGDAEWASDGWSGLILADENSKPAEVAMDVYRATPLEVRVTRGEGHEGIAHTWVHLRSEQQFTWRNAKGANRNAMGGRQEWARTDASGIGRLGVGKGKQKLWLSSGDWNEERTFVVDSDAPLSVEFYRPWLAKRKIAGRLLANNSPHKPAPTAKIEAAAIAQSYQRFTLSSSLQPDGTFEVEGDASDVSILVIDREQRLNGFARVGPNDATIDLPLSTMASYAGEIVDQEGQPQVGKTLRIVVKGTDHLAAEDQVSDDQGEFKFPLAAANVPLSLQIRQKSEGGPYFRQVSELLFVPGEARENARLAVDLRDPEQRRIHPDVSAPLSVQLAKAARNARLGGMHVLAILQGDSSDKVERLAESISNYDDQPGILAYLTLFVDEKMIQSNAATLKELGWQLPHSGEVVLVALDGEAKQLGTERLMVDDVGAAAKLTTALLKQYLPTVRDAQVRLATAQEEAKRTGRKLWIVEGGPRCGPCFRLARWMEDQHAILEKDYVIVKVMGGLDQHAEDVIKPLNRPQSGIPWYAITDVDGKVLVTSESSLGNIGMPSSIEGIRYFREMLTQTAQRLTTEDLDRLAESLADFK